MSVRLAASIVFAAAACGPRGATDAAARAEIERALEAYQDAARAVDPDRIAKSYAPNGVLFEPGIHPIESRDSIRAFIASFPGVKVDSATATADTIEVFGRTAFLWGSYFEKLEFPGQPVSEQHGKFVIEWVKADAAGWLIRRYFRIPIPSPPASDSAR